MNGTSAIGGQIMAKKAVRIILEPNGSRQLGEEGLFILWRDGPEPGRREGLACILSTCPHPGCACELVDVDGFLIDEPASAVVWDRGGVHLERPGGAGAGRVTLEETMMAIVDPSSGETLAHPDRREATDPAMVDWLASETDGELLELLHRFRARAKGYPPEAPREDIALDDLDEYHGIAVEELLDGTRADEYILDDRRFWAATFLCPIPGCDCHEARITFFDDEADSDDAIGSVRVDIGGPSGIKVEAMDAEGATGPLLDELWALFGRRHDVARSLRLREAQLKEVGAKLWRSRATPARAAPKIGRNDLCPCGSRRKYKKCCLGKSAAPGDAGGSSKTTR